MLFWVVRIDKDVIQINDYRDVNHISKYVIHEPLETGRCSGKPFGHHQPLKRPIVGVESGFPFIPSCNVHTVVSMPKVNLSINSCLVWGA